jgi:hypothetical protein
MHTKKCSCGIVHDFNKPEQTGLVFIGSDDLNNEYYNCPCKSTLMKIYKEEEAKVKESHIILGALLLIAKGVAVFTVVVIVIPLLVIINAITYFMDEV